MGVIPVASKQLEKRAHCDGYGYGYYYDSYDRSCDYSAWNAYGRWILAAVVIVGILLLFLLFACITARRRRRMNLRPYPMTAWAAGRPPPGHGPAQYTGQQPPYGTQQGYNQGYQNPPPTYGQAAGYYNGGQESGIAQPNQAYQPPRGGDPVYQAPGEMPPKNDGVVR